MFQNRLTFVEMVRAFMVKYRQGTSNTPRQLPPDVLAFRLKLIHEELTEYLIAVNEGDLVKQFDALIDLQWVVVGTGLAQGFPMDTGGYIVYRSNMQKVIAVRASDSPRGQVGDVIKPANWQPPEPALRELLSQQGHS